QIQTPIVQRKLIYLPRLWGFHRVLPEMVRKERKTLGFKTGIRNKTGYGFKSGIGYFSGIRYKSGNNKEAGSSNARYRHGKPQRRGR
ncbi:MAG: hypothetical protein AAGK79_16685, partial [Pseudomonadota bacterium]